MKRTIIFLLSAVMLIASCKKPYDESEYTVESTDYTGTVSVLYEGEYFDNENIKVGFHPSDDGTSAYIIIYAIKFVPKMPVRIDVTIPDISTVPGADGIEISCDKVIPYALGGEYPKYIVTDFKGSVSENILEFSLNFGDYPTSFHGVKR